MFKNQFSDFIDLDPDWIRIHQILWIQSIRIHITVSTKQYGYVIHIVLYVTIAEFSDQ